MTDAVDSASAAPNHWELHALSWQHFGSPLRPCADDVRWFEQALKPIPPSPHAVLLGVTPELASMQWPQATRLLAVDRCPGMIRHVWPKTGTPAGAAAVRGDWTRIPMPSQSVDVVVGDGIYTLLSFPDAANRLNEEVSRVLAPTGVFLLRAFVRPEEQETLEQIHTDLWAQRIGSFHAYKWRLAMALHGSLEEGVRPADVWQAWHQRVPDPARLALSTGWPTAAIATIESYRESPAHYSFPTLAELQQSLAAQFQIVQIDHLNYELGEQCPLLMLRPHIPHIPAY